MAKKPPTEKQIAARQKFADAARKRAAERKAANSQPVELAETPTPEVPQTPTETPVVEPVSPGEVKQPDFNDLLKQIAELKDNPLIQALFSQQGQQSTEPTSGVAINRGRLVGTVERYITDPSHYPDPCERLAKEPKLQRFAFDQNYELQYQCLPTRPYETKDGVMQTEPQFKIELHGIIHDEETGEPTKGRYLICKSTFFEDPQSAVLVAREQGLEVDDSNEKTFLDEMRYLRMRDWLLEAFYPPRITSKKQNRREVVIGNKVVETWEISSEDSSSIPFSELKSKV